jgi:hypothetical protein
MIIIIDSDFEKLNILLSLVSFLQFFRYFLGQFLHTDLFIKLNLQILNN